MHRRRSPQPRSETSPRRQGLLGVLLVAQLMVILDISAVNVALPDMARDLGISGSGIGWAITSYSLVFGSLLLLGGRAADLLGRRRLFLGGLALFTLASLASAAAADAVQLFAARAGQGLGAALLSPAALSIVSSSFSGRDKGRALGAWAAVGGAGAAVGVLLGGVLTDIADWRAIFYVNVPIGLVLAFAAMRVIPADAGRPVWRGLDLRGGLLAAGSMASLLYGVSRGGEGWASAATLVPGVGGLAGLVLFAALQRRTSRPLLRVQRLADRAIGGGFALMLLASAALFGMFLLSSLFLQTALGASALWTGLAFLPVALAAGVGAHAGSHLVSRLGVRLPMAGGFVAAAAGLLLLGFLDGDSTYLATLLPGLVVAAVGLGVVLVSVAVAVLAGAAEDEAGMLSGLNTTGHELGGSLGIAILVAVATAAAGGATAAPTADGIADAFRIAAAISGAGAVLALTVLPGAATILRRLELSPTTVPLH
jgi:EmrB/QacA subfamily drug resistance transporter